MVGLFLSSFPGICALCLQVCPPLSVSVLPSGILSPRPSRFLRAFVGRTRVMFGDASVCWVYVQERCLLRIPLLFRNLEFLSCEYRFIPTWGMRGRHLQRRGTSRLQGRSTRIAMTIHLWRKCSALWRKLG